MSDQNKTAQPSPSEKGPKNAGGIDDIEEGEDRVEGDERIAQDDGRRAGGGRSEIGNLRRQIGLPPQQLPNVSVTRHADVSGLAHGCLGRQAVG
jgi:hypothetical protein